jgi:hypothetical protein
MPWVSNCLNENMSSHSTRPTMGMFWFFFLLMLVLHQDFWNWSSAEILFLGMPVGLSYHAFFSVACSLLGSWAVIWAWPASWEKYAEETDNTDANQEHSPQ